MTNDRTTYRTVHTDDGRMTLETEIFEDGSYTITLLESNGEEIAWTTGDIPPHAFYIEYVREREDDLLGFLGY